MLTANGVKFTSKAKNIQPRQDFNCLNVRPYNLAEYTVCKLHLVRVKSLSMLTLKHYEQVTNVLKLTHRNVLFEQ